MLTANKNEVNMERSTTSAKSKTGTKKKTAKNAAKLSSLKFENVATKQPSIAEGVRMSVENLCNPTCPQLLPCGTGARVFPTYYHREETLQAEDTSNAFNGVATLRPHRGSFLQIDTDNAPAISVNGVDLPGTELVNSPVIYELGRKYSPVFKVVKSGTLYAVSQLRPVGSELFWGQNAEGHWVQGFVNVVETQAGASSNANFSNLVFQPADTTSHGALDVTLGEINLADGSFGFYATTPLGQGSTVSGALPDLAGTHTGYLTYVLSGSDATGDGELFNVKCAFGSVDLTALDGNVVVYPPVSEDSVYATLTAHSTKYRMDAMSLLLQFRGADMTNAGSVAIALVPEGTNLPLGDPAACYAAISKLPYDKYTGPLKNGAHCFWRPATIRELLFTDNRVRDPQLASNFIVVAWLSPATTAGQPPEVVIKVDSVWEWVFDSQSLPQFRAPFGWSYLEALYASISMYNPAGENPNHMKKVKEIAKKVASNPVVRKLATDAVNMGLSEAKKLLPVLMGGLLV